MGGGNQTISPPLQLYVYDTPSPFIKINSDILKPAYTSPLYLNLCNIPPLPIIKKNC